MRGSERLAAAALVMGLAGMGGSARAHGQVRSSPQTGMPPISGDARPGSGKEPDPMTVKMEEQQAKSRAGERQKRLQADTDRLLGLATQLKQEVDKTDKNTLSVDVIKKAEEIEKLARSVRERMKG